jgi:hypothetical protein
MTVPIRLVGDGTYSALNVTAATNYGPDPITVYKVIVNVTAAAASYVIDSTGTTQTAANTVLTIPASTTVGTVYTLNWPFQFGFALVPGAGVTLSASYSTGTMG